MTWKPDHRKKETCEEMSPFINDEERERKINVCENQFVLKHSGVTLNVSKLSLSYRAWPKHHIILELCLPLQKNVLHMIPERRGKVRGGDDEENPFVENMREISSSLDLVRCWKPCSVSRRNIRQKERKEENKVYPVVLFWAIFWAIKFMLAVCILSLC